MYILFFADLDLKIKKTSRVSQLPCKNLKCIFFLSVTLQDMNSRVGSNHGPIPYADDDDDDDNDDDDDGDKDE